MLARLSSRLVLALYLPIAGAFFVIALWSVTVDRWTNKVALGVVFGHEVKRNLTHTGVWPGIDAIKDIFVFGDSWTDTFFDINNEQPTYDNPFGNHLRPSLIDHYNISTWVRYFHEELITSPRVFNFAFGGSKIESDAYEPWPQQLPPLKECTSVRGQVRCWMDKYAIPEWHTATATRQWSPETTLFVIWGGINDVFEALIEADAMYAVDAIFGSLCASIEVLYREGGRHFLILNLPPLHETAAVPYIRPMKPFVEHFNERWNRSMEKLVRRRPDANFFLFDAYRLLEAIIADPSLFPQSQDLREMHDPCAAYGGTGDEVKKLPECALRRDEYFWLADLHPGPAVHSTIGSVVHYDCFRSKALSKFCSSPWHDKG